MSRRFYVCPIIGTGTITDPYRAAITDAVRTQNRAGSVAVIRSNPDGTPVFPWTLCVAAAPNHVAITNVQGVEGIPDITLDSTLGTMQSSARNRILNFLTNKGVDTSGITTSSTLAELLTRVGRHLDPNFAVLNFDAVES